MRNLILWMIILLGINWGGFVYLLWRTSKREKTKAKHRQSD